MLSAQHIFFDSENASSKNALGNKCRFELLRPIYLLQNMRSYITLKMFRYSNVFYNITASNSTIYTNTGLYTVQPGAYNVNLLASALATIGMVLIYDEITLKVSLKRSDNGAFILEDGANSMHATLGYTITGASQVTHVAQNIIRLAGISVLNIVIDNMRIESNTERNSTINHCIASVPNSVKTGQINTYVPQANISYQTHERAISHIDIHVLDEHGSDVDFNGSSFYIAMQMTFDLAGDLQFNPLQGGAIQMPLAKDKPDEPPPEK